MYTVAVKQEFTAQHFLIGGVWGAENQKHLHHYEIEVLLEGECLNEHGYLIDIDEVKSKLKTLTSYFRDSVLNELTEFHGINPSIEHLARIIHQKLFTSMYNERISSAEVKVWEDTSAWAAYRKEF